MKLILRKWRARIIIMATGFIWLMAGICLAVNNPAEVVAWGNNEKGQCTVPEGLSNIVDVVSGFTFSAVLRDNGTVAVWGNSSDGLQNIPAGLTNVKAIACGSEHIVALKDDGTAVAWGQNLYGQTNMPAGLSGVVAIAAGQNFNLALKDDGTVAGWGQNSRGQTDIPDGLSNVVAIAAGQSHSAALRGNGTVVVWGSDSYGLQNIPAGLTNVTAIASGSEHIVALKADGTVVAWGLTALYRCDVPSGLAGVVAISANSSSSMALRNDGTVVYWGTKSFNQHILPAGLSGVIKISAGGRHCLVLVEHRPPEIFVKRSTIAVHAGQRFGVVSRTFSWLDCQQAWFVAGNPVPFNTNANWTVAAAAAGDAGDYFLVASNAMGITTSQYVTVTVDPAPFVATVPCRFSRVPSVGKPLKLTANAWGEAPLTYTWILNGVTVHSAAVPYWDIAALDEGQTGVCQLLVSNSHGTASSRPFDIRPIQNGEVVAWGSNSNNQRDVPQGLSNVVAVAAGAYHSLALKDNGTVEAWGDDGEGQSSVPDGLSHVVTIAAGPYNSLALIDNGTIIAWGDQFSGPDDVPGGLSNVVALSATYDGTMALDGNGVITAWGIGSNGGCDVPPDIPDITAIAAGDNHNLALTAQGEVVAWGLNDHGQCNVPAGLSNVVAIAGGGSHSLALKDDGTVVAWGLNNLNQCSVPAELSGVTAIGAGNCHSVALKADGTVVAWGANDQNQCNVPAELSPVISLAAGDDHNLALVRRPEPEQSPISVQPRSQVADASGRATLAVVMDGSGPFAFQWYRGMQPVTNGTGAVLQLAGLQRGDDALYHCIITSSDGPVTSRLARVSMQAARVVAWGDNLHNKCNVPQELSDLVAIAAGWHHGLALRADGTVAAWGNNEYHQCDIPPGLSDVVAIAAGPYNSLALKSDGTVIAWGDTRYEQDQVPAGLRNVVAIGAGTTYCAALKMDGTMAIWGTASMGEPALPDGLSDVAQISCGSGYCLVRKHDGAMVIFGYDSYGVVSAMPQDLSATGAFVAGPAHALAHKADGAIAAWGNNGDNQCLIPAGLSDMAAFAAGLHHSAALKRDGTIVAWGYNAHGLSNVPQGLGNVSMIAAGLDFNLAITDPQPLTITTEQTSIALHVGQKLWLGAAVESILPYEAAWFHAGNGSPLGTGVCWSVAAAAAGDSGDYYLVASNAMGVTTSQYVNVTVNPAPFVAILPCRYSRVPSLGRPLKLTANAWGKTPLTYTWILNGTPVHAATVPYWNISALVAAQTGTWQLTVSNSYGAVTSRPFALRPVEPSAAIVWGNTRSGVLDVPLSVTNAVGLAAGGDHALALFDNGAVAVWGNNGDNQHDVPQGLADVVAVAAGGAHSLALKSDGTVAAWGRNYEAQCDTPSGMANVVAVEVGAYHSVALKADGSVVAWGENAEGQCDVPPGLSEVVALAAGHYHNLALTADGTVVAWGLNESGQCTVPAGLANVVMIAAGVKHSLALKADGTVVAWGDNEYGQGVVPAGLNNVTAISAGMWHNLAMRSGGSVVTWGSAWYGLANLPVSLVNVMGIAAGNDFSLALLPPITVKVTFNAAGGTVSPASKTVTVGQPYGALPAPQRAGYNFAGWFDGTGSLSTMVEATTIVALTTNHMVYAHWEAAGGGDDGDEPWGGSSYFCDPAPGAALATIGGYDGFFYGTTAIGETTATAVRGTLALKLGSLAGKLSAKVVLQAVNLTFAGKAWSGELPDGTKQALLTARSGEVLEIMVRQERIWGTLSGGRLGAEVLALDGGRNRFADRGDAGAAALLAQFKGYYTVALPASAAVAADAQVNAVAQGAGYLAMTVGNNGAVRIAGVLADGTRVSRASRLILYEGCAGMAAVPLFVPLYSKRGWAGGLLWFAPQGVVAMDYDNEWFIVWDKPGRGADGFKTALRAYGGFYGTSPQLAGGYLLDAQTAEAFFHHAGGAAVPAATLADQVVAVAGARLTIAPGKAPVKILEDRAVVGYQYGSANPTLARLMFMPGSGIFKGSFTIYYEYELNGKLLLKGVKAVYAGIMTMMHDPALDSLPQGLGYVIVPDNNPATSNLRLKRSYLVTLQEVR